MAYQPHPPVVPINPYDDVHEHLSKAMALNYVLWTCDDISGSLGPVFWLMEGILEDISDEVDNMRDYYRKKCNKGNGNR